MSSKSGLITSDGLRVDGRRRDEVRRMNFLVRISPDAAGSAEVDVGGTRVQATVFGPAERPSSAPERSVLNVQFRVSTLANAEFKALSSKSRQNEETGAIIKRTFDPVIIRKTFERSIINLHVLVLQSDGGVLSAAINAASLALADASIPMLDYVCSCSAGILQDRVLTDLSYLEETAKIPTLTIATTPKKGKIIMIEENSPITPSELEMMVGKAIFGCKKVHEKINRTIKDSINELLQPVK